MLAHLVILVIVSVIFLGFVPDSFASHNSNLFITPEIEEAGIFGSHQVVEVIVIDSDIDDIDEAKGEPEVSVNGEILRMVQAEDGNWYGYFADLNAAQIADSNADLFENQNFGTFCGPNSTILNGDQIVSVTDTVGIAISSSDGINGTDPPTVPIPDCTTTINPDDSLNVISNVKPINTESPSSSGQIGLDANAWPFIQLYSLNTTDHVVIQYNKGGGVQNITVQYDSDLPPFGDGSGGGGGGLIPPNPEPTDTPNLNVITGNPQFPNSIIGPDVVTIEVIDSDIDDIDEAKGEPDVTVNGKIIRMIQAEDGNWYGYFAELNAAKEADSNEELEGQGLEFGTICTSVSQITEAEGFTNIDLSDSDGVAVGAISCDGIGADPTIQNVLEEPKDLNTLEPSDNPDLLGGQIGITNNAWPLIQLYSMKDGGNVIIQYNKGGGNQTIILSFSESEPPSPTKDSSGGGDDRHDTRPTHFKSWETGNEIVTESFGLGNEFFTLTDNHFTHFDLQEIPTGQTIEVFFKAYADKGVWFNSLHLGVPEVGLANLAEVTIDVEHEVGTVEIIDVIINQDTEGVDENISVSSEMVKCSSDDPGKSCFGTTIKLMLREKLKSHVVALETIDGIRQNHISFLNEGIEITGESLNPMLTKMIPSTVRNEGLLKVTQVEKYSPYWATDDERMFEMNSFGSFKQINQSFERFQDTGNAFTRMHSGFGGIIAYEQNRATQVFDSSEFISESPESFAYIYPETSQRISDELKEEMLIQEQIAKEILDGMVKPQRNY